jgi:hypothetical protein
VGELVFLITLKYCFIIQLLEIIKKLNKIIHKKVFLVRKEITCDFWVNSKFARNKFNSKKNGKLQFAQNIHV